MTGKSRLTIRARRAISGYLFILPFIIGFIAFMAVPLFNSLRMALSDVQISASGFNPVFIGIDNFKKALLIDPEFNQLLLEEIAAMAINAVGVLVVSFVVALLLNQKFKGRVVVRAIFFLPVILTSGVLIGLETDNTLLSGIKEVIKEASPITVTDSVIDVLELTGVPEVILDVVISMIDEVYTIVMASGIQIIVFLSGLQNVPASLYEAADVEGCSKWESFWRITFPLVSPLLIVNVIYTIIDFFMKTNSEVIEKIRETMIPLMDYGFSAAMAWIYFIVAIAMIGICSAIISKGVVHAYE